VPAKEMMEVPVSSEQSTVNGTNEGGVESREPRKTEKKEVLKIRDGKQVYTKQVYPATKLRTWIQDFDYGGDYGPVEVRAQFQATYDAGLTSWMIWSPSNRYTLDALKSE
jgi:hypothetical protein